MTNSIRYAHGDIHEEIPSDALMSPKQFGRYRNSFDSKYFWEGDKVCFFRGEIRAAWDELVKTRPELISRLSCLVPEKTKIYDRFLDHYKKSRGSNPETEELERRLKGAEETVLPLLYEAYTVLQPIVRDNAILFS